MVLLTTTLPKKLLEKKPPLLFTLGTALLLIGGGAIAYLNLSKQGQLRGDLPAGAQLVPTDALMTLSVTTQESQWTKLRQFGTPETQREFDQLLLQWRDRLLTVNGYRYKRDIAPWVGGEATLIFLPQTGAAQPPNGETPDKLSNNTQAVMLIPIADPAKAQALMSEPKDASVSWVGRDYKSVTIQSIKTAAGEPLETAVLGTDWLVVSNAPKGVERIIDIHKGEVSLVEAPGYRRAMKSLPPTQTFARIYVNLPVATQTVGTDTPTGDAQGLAATMSLTAEGLRFQGVNWLDADGEATYAELTNGAGEMPRRLPKETLLMVSSGNFQQLWQSLSESNAPLLPFDPVSLKAGLQSTTGLSLEDDFLPWMNGEFAFGLLPPGQSLSAESEAAPAMDMGQLVLMVQVSDRDAADATWAKLDEVVASRYRYRVEESLVDGLPVTEWVSPFQGITMSHGWLDGNVTFLGVGAPVAGAIAPRPAQSLAETTQFQTLTASTKDSNNGHFFIDLQSLNDLQDTLPIPQLGPASANLTSAIQALGVTATIQDEHSIYYDVSVQLAKGARAGSLKEAAPADTEDDAATVEE
ncbi:MAG: DUF3352 domain-containing protein [Cyanobacteria bacterium J06628_6]